MNELFSYIHNEDIHTGLLHVGRNLVPGEWTIVGGVAIQYFVERSRLHQYRHPIQDIDLIATGVDALDQSITDDFYISHFHPYKDDRFFVSLISKTAPHIKVDIFPIDSYRTHFDHVLIDGNEVQITTPESQLVHSAEDIFRITTLIPPLLETDIPIDPKYFDHVTALQNIAIRKPAEEMWLAKYQTLSLPDAIQKAREIAHKYPQFLKSNPFRKSQPYTCSDCVIDSTYPITPMTDIFNLLNYVE